MSPSPRPEIVVDSTGSPVSDAVDVVGFAGPLGRHRLVAALPIGGTGPLLIRRARALADSRSLGVVDAAGTVLGTAGTVWVHRLLYAQRTPDTRRL
jgi:hypothetical protein